MSALDLPIFIKPYYDGEVVKKSASGAYDSFSLAPFAKKRAAYYLTQGCSPIPTSSCGTNSPELPAVYVGESIWTINKNVDNLPWTTALSGTGSKQYGPSTCVYDPECRNSAAADGSGCIAGGKQMCKFCGFGSHNACPKTFDCADGGLHQGLWSEEKRHWCCSSFSIGCDAPYDCLKDLSDWRNWPDDQKSWCCTYQEIGCSDECSKVDPSTFTENHDFWCNTFGNTAVISMYHLEGSQQSLRDEPVKPSTLTANLVVASSLALLSVMGVVMVGLKRGIRSRTMRLPEIDRLRLRDSESDTEVTIL